MAGFNYKAYYEKNKPEISKKRKSKYHSDPNYRTRALEASRRQRERQKETISDAYTIPFNQAAEQIGVTVWTLREWRKKNYFREPKHRNGRLWFTENQVLLLEKLQAFFVARGHRVSEAKRQPLQELVQLIAVNWDA